VEQSQKHFSVLEKEHNYVSTVLNINHIIIFLHTVQILTTECYFSKSKVCSKCDKSSKNIHGTSEIGTSLYTVQSCPPSVSSRSIISTLRMKYLSLRRYSPPIGPVTETDALLLLALHNIMSPSKRNTRRSVSRRPLPTFPSTSSATAHIHSWYTHFSKIYAV